MIDKYPVTNEAFSTFLTETRYKPEDGINFLKHWSYQAGIQNGGNNTAARTGTMARTMPAGVARLPVVFVSLSDAQAYCTHQGLRLPNEWEWAYAAQGGGARRWPWGNTTRQECMPPSFNENNKSPTLPAVDAFDARGCGSPFGVQLMTGSVWQWTNALADAHTRTAFVKGGSSYWRTPTPLGRRGGGTSRNREHNRSFYYFGNCAQETWQDFERGQVRTVVPTECHGELYLMDSGYERASTVGFRCAADDGPQPPQPPPVPPSPPPPRPPPPSPGPPSGGCKWYGGESSTAPACSWTDGSPDESSGAKHQVKSGLYAYTGTFALNITRRIDRSAPLSTPGEKQPELGPPALKKLTIYAGIFCAAAELTVSMPGGSGVAPVTKTVQPPKTPVAACRALGTHATKNFAFVIYYTPPPSSGNGGGSDGGSDSDALLSVTWKSIPTDAGDSKGEDGSGSGDGEDDETGNITWQSATLSEAPSGTSCAESTICVAEPALVASSVDLTSEGVLDWIHFGGLDTDPFPGTPVPPAPLYPERKKCSDGGYFSGGFLSQP